MNHGEKRENCENCKIGLSLWPGRVVCILNENGENGENSENGRACGWGEGCV